MNPPTSSPTRDIARTAVRAELARVAFELFRRDGFDNVTLHDIAVAAGVSRSTFLRYCSSKEDPVLGFIDAQGEAVVAALCARPADEDDWAALRRALEALIDDYRRDPAGTLARSQLIVQTPVLCASCRERQAAWQPALAAALSERGNVADTLTAATRVAAAIDCLNVASEHWAGSDGRLDLGDLLDQTFAALVPARTS